MHDESNRRSGNTQAGADPARHFSKNGSLATIARVYIRRKMVPIPIPYRRKKPRGDKWQDLRITEDTVDQYFNGKPQNIGVLLGPASGNLTDVDLDCREAIAVAPYFLPPTKAI